MTTNVIPPWYPFQEQVETTLTFEEQVWKQLLLDRITLLGVNGQKEFKKDRDETNEEYKKRGNKDIQGHIVLRFSVCLDPRLSAWFIEMEGDLFEYRFRRSSWTEKTTILNFLFPTENLDPVWLLEQDLSHFLGIDIKKELNIQDDDSHRQRTSQGLSYRVKDQTGIRKIIGLDFRYASMLVKHRRAKLYQGWIVDSVERLLGTIKKKYEKLINQELAKFAKKIEGSTGSNIKKLGKEMNELVHGLVKTKRDFRVEGISLKGNFDDHFSYYPPCIQDLITLVDKTGYIPHWERFQLGLFLKHTGMHIDDQLQYWYSKAVDNINLSYDEFVKRAGYIIRHIYGLVGAKIDYEMPSCHTIQTKMYCTFRHADMSNINSKLGLEDDVSLDTTSTDTSDIAIKREIISLTTDGHPNVACARYFKLQFNKNINAVKHPMYYLRMATKDTNIIEADVEKNKTDVTTEDKNEINQELE